MPPAGRARPGPRASLLLYLEARKVHIYQPLAKDPHPRRGYRTAEPAAPTAREEKPRKFMGKSADKRENNVSVIHNKLLMQSPNQTAFQWNDPTFERKDCYRPKP